MERHRSARGASLAGVLVIVVVLGGLAATAVIGVNSMTASDTAIGGLTTTTRVSGGHGGTAGIGLGGAIAPASARVCQTAAGAANAASSAYFVNTGGHAYPAKWSDLTSASPALYVLPTGVVVDPRNPSALDGNGWKLVMAGNGTAAPTFTCKEG